MLSSNNSSPTPGTSKHFETIIASIKAPLSDLYGKGLKFSLTEDLSDEQFQQLETVMDETIAEWRSQINLESFTQWCLKAIKAEINKNKIEVVDDATAENQADEEKSDGEEKELNFAEIEAAFKLHKETEKKRYSSNDANADEKAEEFNLAEVIEKDFHELSIQWNIEINFSYNNNSFIKFIDATISKNRVHFLHVKSTLSEDAVDKILIACKDLPEDSIHIIFSKNQDITDNQGLKILAALKSLSLIEFTEKENTISESTAKSLAYSKYRDKLWIEGDGIYKQLQRHNYLVESCDMRSIFMNGEECSTEEIEKLLSGLSGRKLDFGISSGIYTTPAWQHFFTKSLQENSCEVYALEIGRLVDDNFTMSNEVLSTIFTALKTNKSVWKLVLRMPLSLAQVTELADALRINESIQELHLRCESLTPPMLAILFSALNANPNCKVTTLSLNHSTLGDNAAAELGMLISQNTKLLKLMLGSTYIGNQTCKAIADALKINKTLKMLSVFDNDLDDEALTNLSAGLLDNETLEELHILQSRKFSPQAIECFLKAREQNYILECTIDLVTEQNLKRAQEISARNKTIRLNASSNAPQNDNLSQSPVRETVTVNMSQSEHSLFHTAVAIEATPSKVERFSPQR